jgi:hypothetical protein
MARSIALRLEEQTNKTDSCWLWTGRLQPSGYALITVKQKGRSVHRLAWEVANGPIPDGLFVLHRCDVRHCLNPAHLFLGTHGDNMRDMFAKRRDPAGLGIHYQQQKTHCPMGHPLSGDNLVPSRANRPSKSGRVGHRSCLECSRRQWRESKRRAKARMQQAAE